jgi:N-acetylglutamate synthase-like GNAT family acetyltransferase
MDQLAISIRRASERDQQAIRALVHSERLNPTGISWPNFVVAVLGGRIIGAVQMRKHSDGSRELGSLVVSKDARGCGIASRLIDVLLAEEQAPVWMITADPYAGAYSRWGFEQIEARAAPVKVRRNHLMGRLASIISLVMRRPIRRLVILERLPRTVRRERPTPVFAKENLVGLQGLPSPLENHLAARGPLPD